MRVSPFFYASDSHRCLDRGPWVIAGQVEVVIRVRVDARRLVDAHMRVRARLAFELLHDLFQVVPVDVCVSAHPDEPSWPVAGLLGDHHGQERVFRDVERHAEEHVAGTLVQLAVEPVAAHMELEQAVAWRQCHPA